MARSRSPLWPARRITVSPPMDRALDTLVSRFTANKFRLTSQPGSYPATLEYGSRTLPILLASLWFVPGKIGENSKFGQVRIELDSAIENTITVALTDAVVRSQMAPIVLRAMDEAVAAFTDAGVLIEAGPVVSARRTETPAR